MLYDQQKMSPLFILSIGNAGSSFALNIAQNTGLPADLIADAEEIAGKNYIDMDKYLQDIARDKRHWEQMRRQIDMQQERLQQLAEQYTLQRQEFETQRKQLLLQAKSEALGIINRANSQIENTVRAIREAEADKEKTKILRQQVANYKQQLQTEISDHNKSQPPAARSKKNKNRQQKSQTPETEIHLLQPGDAVRLKGQKNAGKVLEIKGMNATVAFGNIKSVIGVDNLEYVNPASLKNNLLATPSSVSKQTMDKIYETRLNFRQDIDLRGMYGEEALQALVYFIDDAIEVGASRVRILHGTGNGILRQIVRQYLAGVSGVARYHDEHVQFGGAGITVVDFE
jgi:DNA mismatch repair protein MutS2